MVNVGQESETETTQVQWEKAKHEQNYGEHNGDERSCLSTTKRQQKCEPIPRHRGGATPICSERIQNREGADGPFPKHSHDTDRYRASRRSHTNGPN